MPVLRTAYRWLTLAGLACLLVALGLIAPDAQAETGRDFVLTAGMGTLEDVSTPLEPGSPGESTADPIHPWDNSDFSDTLASGDPGRLQRKTTRTPEDPLALDTVEALRSGATTPDQIGSLANYPNPFNAQTRVEFYLGVDGAVRLEIYNLLGQVVELVEWTHLTAGRHSWTWNGMNRSGRPASSGVYFARLEVGGSSVLHKMVLLK